MSKSDFPLSCIGRLRGSCAGFARDESGGATIWNVTWLLVFAGMAGLSIDASNGYRNIAISQSTSDAAVLAGAQELPHPFLNVPFDPDPEAYDDTVKARALEFSGLNMPWEPYGQVLMQDEIFIGNWYNPTGNERRFTSGERFQDLVDDGIYASVDDVTVNAVRVYLFQDENDRGNGVATSLMHMAGVPYWTVATTATAVIGWPDCLEDGMWAEKKVCITSNNDFYPGFCIHGERGINLKNNNNWYYDAEGEGSVVTHGPNYGDNIAASNYDEPYALDGVGLRTGGIPYVNHIGSYAQGILGFAMGEFSYDGDGLSSDFSGTDLNVTDGPRFAIGGPDFFATENGAPLPPLKISNEIGANVLDPDPVEEQPGGSDPGNENPGGGNKGGGSNNPTDGTGPFGCEGGGGAGTLYSDSQMPSGSLYASDAFQDAVLDASGGLPPNRVYYYPGSGLDGDTLTINTGTGMLSDVIVISEAPIEIAANSRLEGVMLITMSGGNVDEEGNVGHAVKLGQGVQMGRADNCATGGGVVTMAVGSIKGASGNTWNGTLTVSGGNVHLAAQQEGIRGSATYAKGNVFYTANNTFGAPEDVDGGIADSSEGCSGGVQIFPPTDSLRTALVD